MRPGVLFDLATAHLVAQRVVLPGVSLLARLIARVRERTGRLLYRQLQARLSGAQRDRLDALLVVSPGERTPLEVLRTSPTRVSAPALVAALRRREVFAPISERYGDPRTELLRGAAWEAAREAVARALARSTDPAVELDRLRQQVRAAYREVSDNLDNNTALQVLKEDGQPYVVLTPLAAQTESAGLARLRQQLRARLPPVELAALLLEVAAFTDFTGAFTHLADGQPTAADLPLSLCAVLLAQACNIGLKSVARPEVPALTLPHLVWVQHNYLRVETLTVTNARLVDAQAQLPLAQA